MKNLISIVAAMVACASIAGCGNPSQNTRENAMPNHGGSEAAATCKADAAPDDALVGKPEAEAAAMLGGCAWRVGERDGRSLPGTMDYREDRRNLGIEAGKVIWVRRG
ncbi:LptM family lipoprotein [Burkholderia sp. F1]|uniref:LptM family lipoprotein n=1 Tax=Burkholderia sp. F1 TaxID=3366817 RepID=UPI003D74D286